MTIDRTDDSGFVTAYPAGTPLPTASTINAFGVNDTIANFAITPISNRGSAYFSDRGTDLIVDVTGYFTGTPMTATLPVPPNVQPPARALLVGDSTLAGVRWYGTTEALLGYPYVLTAESCRRLADRVVPWARGLHADQRGHRDPQRQRHVRNGRDHGRIRRLVDGVLEQLRPGGRRGPRQGRTEDRLADVPRGRRIRQSEWRQRQRGVREEQRDPAREGRIGPVPRRRPRRLARLHRRRRRAGWPSDGIHLTLAGSFGAADYISRYLAHLENRACPMPWVEGAAVDIPCPNPDVHGPVADILSLYH